MVVAQRGGACAQLLGIRNVCRRDLVNDIGSRVTQHELRSDVEEMDDSLLVGGDHREIGAVENGLLQSARFLDQFVDADLGKANMAGGGSKKGRVRLGGR